MKSKIQTTKKILRIKVTILVLAILPFVVFTLLTSKTDKLFGVQSFVVLTGSMEPNIPQGSLVFTKKQQAYNIGDVIAFKEGNITITHRVAAKAGQGNALSYKTKGDANNTTDSNSVAASNILGKAENSIPYLGSFVLFLRSLPGFLLLIVLPVVVFIGFELWNIKKEIEFSTERRIKKQLGVEA